MDLDIERALACLLQKKSLGVTSDFFGFQTSRQKLSFTPAWNWNGLYASRGVLKPSTGFGGRLRSVCPYNVFRSLMLVRLKTLNRSPLNSAFRRSRNWKARATRMSKLA